MFSQILSSQFSSVFCALATTKTLFAYSSQYGNCETYSKQMFEEFKAKCADYAKKNPDFEFQVENVNIKNKAELAKALKTLNDIDHLVVTNPIHKGGFESSMSKFLKQVAKANPKKLKSGAAFGACGEANSVSHPDDKKGNEKLASFKTVEERDKFLAEKRKELTNKLVVANLVKNCGPDMAKKFPMVDVLPGQIQLEKYPLYMKLLFRFVLGIKKGGGDLDLGRSKQDIQKFFESTIPKKQ